jgi:hypothetical protein
MFTNNRQELRQYFFDVWKKVENKTPLIPLEEQVAAVIVEHPEYHNIFQTPEKFVDKDFSSELGETNPFLHMSLHLSIREQIQTNRPDGIKNIFQTLCKKMPAHDAEHCMMEILAEMIWQAQRHGKEPDQNLYLERLAQL